MYNCSFSVVMALARRLRRTIRWVLTLAFAALGVSTAFAQVGFAPGCGPFALGAPNTTNYPFGNQIPINFAIPPLGFALAGQPAGCPAYTGYRLAASSQALPAGISFAGSGAATPVVFFSGTPTVAAPNRNLVFEVTVNGTDWATALLVTLDVTTCLSWHDQNTTLRFQATYSPASAIENNRGLVPTPVAGVPYDTTVTLLPDRYPAAAYCVIPAWNLQYLGGANPSGLTATSVAGTPLSLRITGTPIQSGSASDCFDGGQDMAIISSAGIPPTALFFCFSGVAPPALALVGSPPSGRVNALYSTTFTTNPATTATFTLLSGALPPGLGLTSAGVLSGTPTTAGTYNFSVQANAGAAGTANGNFSITIAPVTIPPAQPTTNVPTLSQWALSALALACVVLVRRRLKR
jgi:Putative Ig domain/IPTL-CTERM motif